MSVPAAGEYRLAANFANAGTAVSKLDVLINGTKRFTAPFPRTEAWGTFSRNLQFLPVTLQAGTNTIRLQRNSGFVELDYVDLGPAPTPVYAAEQPVSVADAGFETGSPAPAPSGWTTWPGASGTSADADYTEAGGYAGGYRLTQAKSSAYEVYTGQTITGLANGVYTLTAQAVSGGGQSAAYLSAKAYSATGPELTAPIPATGWPNWRQVVISGIAVTNGQLAVGVYSAGSGGQWLSLDAVTFTRQ